MRANKRVFFLLLSSGLILLIFLIMQPLEVLKYQDYIALLFPKGMIGLQERNLLFLTQAIMLIIVLPVYALTFIFSWKYCADNPKAKYDPDLVDHTVAEVIWWGLPLVLTIIICMITWYKTHELDPFKAIAGQKPQKTIQVVALQWKWLFIYPEEKIASLNFLQIPKDTPIHFEITADAPMNSFWIPQLGGQIYAMPSMKTELFLIADTEGDFRGSSANISGEGFAGMHFITHASTEESYQHWIETAKKSSNALSWKEYEKLAAPSQNNPPELFQLKDETLFNQILMKFMHPKSKE